MQSITPEVAAETLRRLLRGWALYRDYHDVRAAMSRGILCLTYESIAHAEMYNQTHLTINVDGPALYLLSIGIDRMYRGRGLGRQLYEIAEEFAREMDCEAVMMTCSGHTSRGEFRGLWVERSLGYEVRGCIATKRLKESPVA